jgi:lactate dehydrogenase-like 2-hydroxyacid dehydrogenase
MTLRILYPDAQFDGEPSVEAEVFGPRASLTVYRPSETTSISEDTWRTCDAIVCYHDLMLDETLVRHLERCRLIVRAGVGFDQIDIAACAMHGIPVCNTPDYGTTDVADHAIALTLALARGIVAYYVALKADLKTGWDFAAPPTIQRLSGRVFGVVGLGRIGTATALRAKALGMQVVFFDPYRPTGTELALGITRAGSLSDLLAIADVVSLHTPLSTETKGLIDRTAVSRMKPGALLINTARGPIVDPDAVLDGLRSGQLAGAALDVLPVEPPVGDEPLLVSWRNGDPALAGRLILSPHAAFYSASSLADLRRKSAEVAVDYLFSGRLRDCVNGLDLPGTQRR